MPQLLPGFRGLLECFVQSGHDRRALDGLGAFQQARMDERIAVLKDHLPPFLVEQRKLYSILSKGIHFLTEKECIEAFPVVRVGTELILDQKVAAKRQEHKMNEAKKQIAMLQQKLKST
jgi:hypothetical protein